MSKTGVLILLFFLFVEVGFIGWQLFLNKELKLNPQTCTEQDICRLGATCIGGPERDRFEWSSLVRPPSSGRDQTLNRVSQSYDKRNLDEEIGECRTWLDSWTGATDEIEG